MRYFMNASVHCDDDKFVMYKEPIRSEVVESTLVSVALLLRHTYQAIEDNGFDISKLQHNSAMINGILTNLNNSEREFLNWVTTNFLYKVDKSITNIPYWLQEYGKLGLDHFTSLMGVNNYSIVQSTLRRLADCLSLNEINALTEYVYCEDFNSVPQRTDMDSTYNQYLKKYVEYMIQEYIAIRNAQINMDNRNNELAYRTCSKCGTRFQKTTSRNMHFPKCRGINKGYITPKTSCGRTSEW